MGTAIKNLLKPSVSPAMFIHKNKEEDPF